MVDPDGLRPFALFSQLSQMSRSAIAAHCARRHFEKREMLLRQGEPAKAFFLLEYGRIKVYRSAPDGREQILHIVEPWQSLAEVAVLSMESYPASAEALADSACIMVPRVPFLGLVRQDAQAARAMIAGQAVWLRRLVDQSAALVLEDVLTRLARYLIVHADTQGMSLASGSRIRLDVPKSSIAAHIGTVPETLARNIKKLCNLGAVERAGRDLIVRDADKLRAIAYAREE